MERYDGKQAYSLAVERLGLRRLPKLRLNYEDKVGSLRKIVKHLVKEKEFDETSPAKLEEALQFFLPDRQVSWVSEGVNFPRDPRDVRSKLGNGYKGDDHKDWEFASNFLTNNQKPQYIDEGVRALNGCLVYGVLSASAEIAIGTAYAKNNQEVVKGVLEHETYSPCFLIPSTQLAPRHDGFPATYRFASANRIFSTLSYKVLLVAYDIALSMSKSFDKFVDMIFDKSWSEEDKNGFATRFHRRVKFIDFINILANKAKYNEYLIVHAMSPTVFDFLVILIDHLEMEEQMANHERETEKGYAKAFETKQNIPQKILEAMQTSPLLNLGVSEVEYDEITDLNKLPLVWKSWNALAPHLPNLGYLKSIGVPMPNVRFRRLGNYRSLGIYFSAFNAVVADVRFTNSLVHEFGHYLDYSLGRLAGAKTLSLTDSLLPLVSAYRKDLQTRMRGLSRDQFNYFTTPTEVFARAYEIYVWAKNPNPNVLLPTEFQEEYGYLLGQVQIINQLFEKEVQPYLGSELLAGYGSTPHQVIDQPQTTGVADNVKASPKIPKALKDLLGEDTSWVSDKLLTELIEARKELSVVRKVCKDTKAQDGVKQLRLNLPSKPTVLILYKNELPTRPHYIQMQAIKVNGQDYISIGIVKDRTHEDYLNRVLGILNPDHRNTTLSSAFAMASKEGLFVLTGEYGFGDVEAVADLIDEVLLEKIVSELPEQAYHHLNKLLTFVLL